MARRRYVSTDISTDSLLVKLQKNAGFFGPLLYTWMLPHAGDDCHITADLDELQLKVLPGLKVKPEMVKDSVAYMLELGLLRQDERGLYFPPKSFYKHQSYIPENKRWVEPNAAECRETPQITASPSLSLSPSPSVSPSPSPSLSTRENGAGDGDVEFHPTTAPPFPDDPEPAGTYVGRYVLEHQKANAGNPPSPIHQGAAKKLERDFGTAACIEVAEDIGWDRHPNYLREVLNDPNRGKRTNPGQSRTPARPDNGNRDRAAEARAVLARR